MEEKIKSLRDEIQRLEKICNTLKEIHDDIRKELGLEPGESTIEAIKKLKDNQRPDAQIINLKDPDK